MPTKIMYLVDCYEGPQAGTEGQLLQLVQHLDRSRYEPSMTLLRASEYFDRISFPCPVRVLGISKLASVRTILRILRFSAMLRRQNYRLVHCFFNDSALMAPPFLRLFGIRVLVSRRDMGFWYTRRNLAILRLVAPFVDRYVANSQAVKRVVRQQEWVADRKVTVIYNGYTLTGGTCGETQTEESADELRGVGGRGVVVGIVANLKPIKRIDVLLEAFAIASLQYPGARLLVVGDTSSSEEAALTLDKLDRLARRLGIREQVVFTGRVEKPAMYIQKLTVAVLCSESEGFSNSLIEYMQAQRAIVCTDTGGNCELVVDGYNGFLVPVGDSRTLADRLVQLLSDSSLACRFGQAAHKTVRSYTHTRMVSEQMECYDDVLGASVINRSQETEGAIAGSDEAGAPTKQ